MYPNEQRIRLGGLTKRLKRAECGQEVSRENWVRTGEKVFIDKKRVGGKANRIADKAGEGEKKQKEERKKERKQETRKKQRRKEGKK